jgi:hypothetical protein
VAVLVASVIALAACGGTASTAKSDNGDVPGLAAMLGATEQANTARFDLRMHMDGGISSPIDTHANGVIDFAKNRGSASLSAQHPPAKSDETFDMPVEARWLDGKSYERYDPNAKSSDVPVTAAKPWVRDDSGDACASNDSSGFLGAMLGMPGVHTGPANVIDELANRGVALARVGTESIRGTATMHWRADIPKPATPTTLGNSDDCGDDFGGGTPKLEIWTDDENRVRRITMSSSAELGGSPFSVSVTTELYDYGVEVDVTAPPADQISHGSSMSASGSSAPPNLPNLRAVASGTLGSKKWTVNMGNSPSDGGPCFTVEGLPQPSSMISSATCVPRLPVAMVLTDTAVSGERLVIGVVGANLGSVQLTFANNGTATVPVDSKTGLFTWSGSASTDVRTITAGSSSCTLRPVSGAMPCISIDASAYPYGGGTSGTLGTP